MPDHAVFPSHLSDNHHSQIYETELENSDDFKEFTDFCETFDLERGKDDDDEESNIIGQFKVGGQLSTVKHGTLTELSSIGKAEKSGKLCH